MRAQNIAVVGSIIIGFVALTMLSLSAMQPYGVRNMFGMAMGALSFAAMAMCLGLSMRLRAVEVIVGGLDRVYALHKWLGVFAIATMLLHENFHPRFKQWLTKTEIGHFAKESGELMYYPLLLLVAVSFFKRLPFISFELPYGLWRFSHRFLGFIFMAIVVHVMLIDLPIRMSHPLMLWLVVLAVVGVVAFAYVELLLPKLHNHPYSVKAIVAHPDVTELVLQPKAKPLHWKAGQFVFVSSERLGLREPHPFTVASSPLEGDVRIMIKGLGDWTRRLSTALQVGDAVNLKGPYGRFNYQSGGDTQLWVAGGIGITPFLAWAQGLPETLKQRIHLVYVVRRVADALHVEALERVAQQVPQFSYSLVVSERDGRLDAAKLMLLTPFLIGSCSLFYCGPVGLRKTIVHGLAALGEHPKHVHYELFEFR